MLATDKRRRRPDRERAPIFFIIDTTLEKKMKRPLRARLDFKLRDVSSLGAAASSIGSEKVCSLRWTRPIGRAGDIRRDEQRRPGAHAKAGLMTRARKGGRRTTEASNFFARLDSLNSGRAADERARDAPIETRSFERGGEQTAIPTRGRYKEPGAEKRPARLIKPPPTRSPHHADKMSLPVCYPIPRLGYPFSLFHLFLSGLIIIGSRRAPGTALPADPTRAEKPSSQSTATEEDEKKVASAPPFDSVGGRRWIEAPQRELSGAHSFP